jgi:nicotinamide-nucleotide amidase
MNCIIYTIGDELLMGQTIDTNSAFIAQKLNPIGIKIMERRSIADDRKAILDAIAYGMQNHNVIIFTGGLGPTKDDITKKTIADFFNVPLIRHDKTFEHVKAFFEKRNRPFLDVNHYQADVPSNCEVLFNKAGTAPGMWIEHQGAILISLPGVPFEMEYLMEYEVIPRLKKRSKTPALIYSYIQTAGIGESFLAKNIEFIEEALPDYIKLSYLPNPYRVNLRLSTTQEYENEMLSFKNQMIQELGDAVYGESTNTIFEHFFNFLDNRKWLVSFAESCSGGFLVNEMTNISGASRILSESYVVYSEASKMDKLGVAKEIIDAHTVYSAECAEAMAIACLEKSKSHIAIASTGVLETTKDQKPFAFIAIAIQGKVVSRKVDLFYGRNKNKETVAVVAIFEALKWLKKDF